MSSSARSVSLKNDIWDMIDKHAASNGDSTSKSVESLILKAHACNCKGGTK